MSTVKEVVWKLEPHTEAKHRILRYYLNAWFPILSSWNGRIIYLDGFSGPGEYVDGEPGSPIVALDCALNHLQTLKGEVVFWFVDEDERRVENLRNVMTRKQLPPNFIVHIEHGEFHNFLSAVIDYLEKTGQRMAPTFALIDPFGFSGVPMALIQRFLRLERTEALINFQVSFVNRFLTHPDDDITANIEELFGTADVFKIAEEQHRLDALRMLYQQQLSKAAKFVRYFSMTDEHDKPLYDLFFASNHELGHYRMKEAMWRVDPLDGNGFSDGTNPNQIVLFTLDPAQTLLDALLQKFGGKKNLNVEVIRTWVRNETPFLEPHLTKALKFGELKQCFHVNTYKADGTKRIKGSFPDGVVIFFH